MAKQNPIKTSQDLKNEIDKIFKSTHNLNDAIKQTFQLLAKVGHFSIDDPFKKITKSAKEYDDVLSKISNRNERGEYRKKTKQAKGFNELTGQKTSVSNDTYGLYGKKGLFSELESQKNLGNKAEEIIDNVYEILELVQDKATKEQRDYLEKIADDAKRNAPLSKQLDLLQTQENQRYRRKQQVNDLLEAISRGDIDASKEQTKRLLKEQKQYKKQDKEQEGREGILSSFGSSFSGELLQNTLGRIGLGSTADFFSSGLKKGVGEQAKIFAENQKAQKKYQQDIEELQTKRLTVSADSKEREEIDKQIAQKQQASEATRLASNKKMRGSIQAQVIAGASSLMKDLGKKAADLIAQIGKDAINMLNEASSYAVSSSYKVNSQAREQMLKYGLSESQNYAFSKTSELMGISSDEDLFYMNSNQKQMFEELMQKESAIYDEMTQDGTLEAFQKLQIDFAVMKQEFLAEVVKFIVDNKGVIVAAAEVAKNMLKVIGNTVIQILKFVAEIAGETIENSYDDLSSGNNKNTGIISASEASAYRNAGVNTDSTSNSTTNNTVNKTYNLNQNNTINGYNQNAGSLSQSISQSTTTALMTWANS